MTALYKSEIVEEARQKLRSLPPPTPSEISKLEVVRALLGEIEALQKQGHSVQTIAATISEVGIPLTTSTLKTYLGKVRPTGRRTSRLRLRRASAPTAPTTAGNVTAISDVASETFKNAHAGSSREAPCNVSENATGGGKEEGSPAVAPDDGPSPVEPKFGAAEPSQRLVGQEVRRSSSDGAVDATAVRADISATALEMAVEMPDEGVGSAPSTCKATRTGTASLKDRTTPRTRGAVDESTAPPKWTFVPREDSREI